MCRVTTKSSQILVKSLTRKKGFLLPVLRTLIGVIYLAANAIRTGKKRLSHSGRLALPGTEDVTETEVTIFYE